MVPAISLFFMAEEFIPEMLLLALPVAARWYLLWVFLSNKINTWNSSASTLAISLFFIFIELIPKMLLVSACFSWQ
jgi:hypothetical protein